MLRTAQKQSMTHAIYVWGSEGIHNENLQIRSLNLGTQNSQSPDTSGYTITLAFILSWLLNFSHLHVNVDFYLFCIQPMPKKY